jgi:hypothetical protein
VWCDFDILALLLIVRTNDILRLASSILSRERLGLARDVLRAFIASRHRASRHRVGGDVLKSNGQTLSRGCLA